MEEAVGAEQEVETTLAVSRHAEKHGLNMLLMESEILHQRLIKVRQTDYQTLFYSGLLIHLNMFQLPAVYTP